jgi:norsolorinic acid ketoreductase
MASTVVLITGGNRGLGQGLVTRFLAQPNHVSIRPILLPLLSTISGIRGQER